MSNVYDEAFFYFVPHESTLEETARSLYADERHGEREAFLRINADVPVSREGRLLPGQVLYLPSATCRFDEAQIIEGLAAINHLALALSESDRRYLARHKAILHNVAADSTKAREIAGHLNTAANTALTGVQLQTRALGQSLRELEQRYVSTYRRHGRLTADFFRYRQGVYRSLDTTLGRMARSIVGRLGLPADSAQRVCRRRFAMPTYGSPPSATSCTGSASPTLTGLRAWRSISGI